MPYITQYERDDFDRGIDHIGFDLTPGQLNYVITRIIHNNIKCPGVSYAAINETIGVLECAKLELYRMVAAPYEDKKKDENGPISNLDSEDKSE